MKEDVDLAHCYLSALGWGAFASHKITPIRICLSVSVSCYFMSVTEISVHGLHVSLMFVSCCVSMNVCLRVRVRAFLDSILATHLLMTLKRMALSPSWGYGMCVWVYSGKTRSGMMRHLPVSISSREVHFKS